MAAVWAAQVNLRAAVRAMLVLPDAEDRLVQFTQQAHAEGLFAGRTSLETSPRRLTPTEAAQAMRTLLAEPGTPERLLKAAGILTADGRLAPGFRAGDGASV